ncbi:MULTISPECIES: GUN4 domain-containing protein [unclassified Moorena]|uniref:GUN4 domain-containing protein n=1 Tax=unclassified Moorena TaxID=2683338 RepID=UPI001401641E|nr:MULTISPECIES: GUN4 domain-containing protein [unclassified Moorena]NEO17448.1 GUN4 domain-containing protein [Moorena sp. SIO3E8]NEQ04110.1 GUN4 domain-containing protein [Moorena sp. SIO3F7]
MTNLKIDYTHLKTLLMKVQWKAADLETNKIVLSIAKTLRQQQKVSKKDQEWLQGLNYLIESDLLEFPCQDLLTLNQLWEQYSQGHFGFRIQSQLWQQVSQDYNQFADLVGWRKGDADYWHSYSQLTFSLDAPKGHLPAAIFYTEESPIGWAATIKNRLDECFLDKGTGNREQGTGKI